MGTFSVYISLGSVPSLFFSESFILYSLRQESRKIIIKRKMKLLFQLAMTFLALVCLAIAIPAPQHGCVGQACGCCGQRLEESVVEPKKEQNSAELKRAQNLLRMAIPAPRPPKPIQLNANYRGKQRIKQKLRSFFKMPAIAKETF